MMNQAILVMMHKNPEQVVRLVKYFPDDRCTCFIHIDKKCKICVEKFQEDLNAVHKHCIITKERISGQLANWSLAEISLLLLKNAYEYSVDNQIRFSYYRLLSGQDYPIRPFKTYEGFLEKNYPKEYLGIDHYEDGVKHVQDKFKRWRFNGLRNELAWFIRNDKAYKACIVPVYLCELLWTKIKGTPYEWMKRNGYAVAGGPSWWSISDRLASYVVEQVKGHAPVLNIIKYTATPEESVFQILYVNAPWYEKSETYNLTIGNYGENGEKATGHTYPWRIGNLQQLLSSNCFFARKFDQGVDGEILDKLDEIIYKE